MTTQNSAAARAAGKGKSSARTVAGKTDRHNAWFHSLGDKVDESLATSAEAIAQAGLDWEVKKEKVFLDGGIEIKDQYATVRQDNRSVLGMVGKAYHVLQNKTAFSFSDALVGEKAAMYYSAGQLRGGRRVWLLAKLPGHIQVIGDDVTEKYLLFSNSHNGGSMVNIMLTPIRFVCSNTLNVAVTKATHRVRFRHTANMGDRVKEVREGLAIVNKHFEEFGLAAQQLVKVKMKEADFRGMIKKVGLVPNEPDAELSKQAKDVITQLSALFEAGAGTEIKGVRGTAWGAFNAITEYVDHVRGKDADRRADSQLFGGGARLKQRAWDLALTAVRS